MSEQNPKDIDPDLLRETGRASAIQDLAAQAQMMGDRAVALENSTRAALTMQIKRWRRTTMYLAIAIFGLIIMGLIQLRISRDNEEILGDVDSLVQYVEEVEARNESGGNPELQRVFAAIFEIRHIVCVDPTPEVQQACTDLGAGN